MTAGKPRRAFILLGHYYIFVLLSLFVAINANRVARTVAGHRGIVEYVTRPAGSVLVGLIVLTVVAWTEHDRNQFECGRDLQFKYIEDPDRAVRRNRWALQLTHRLTRRWMFVFFGVTFGSTLISSTVPALDDTLAGDAVGAVMSAAVAVVSWSIYQHKNLQSWCPWCRGGDGDGPKEVVPDPDPSVTNPNPVRV